MNILALDIGEQMGAACNAWGWYHDSPPVAMSFKIETLRDLLDLLEGLYVNDDGQYLDAVYYEDAFAQPGKANARFHEKVGVIKLMCEQHGLPKPIGVPVLTWHRWAREYTGFAPRPRIPKRLRDLKRWKSGTKAERKRLQKRHDRNKRTYNKLFKLHLYHEAERRSGLCMPDNNASDAWWVLQYYDEFVGVL